MNLLFAAAVFASLFTNSGCRSARDNQIDILERELRAQEDYIYELEDYIVDYSEKLRAYRCAEMESVVVSKSPSEPELAPPRRTTSQREAGPKSETVRSLEDLREETAPEDDAPEEPLETPDVSPETLEVPDLEIGEPVSMDEAYETATPLAEADIEGTLLADGSFVPNPAAYQTSIVEEAAVEEEIPSDADLVEDDVQPFDEEEITPTRSREPERLVISHVFRNTSDAEQPTSLLSIIEARDASNEPADFNGRVSLMVMTIANEKLQKVKRWDFTPEETSAAWQSSSLGDGLHLELPLEEIELPEGPLELWVRLETADGRKLLSQTPFEGTTLASIEQADEHVALQEEEIEGATHLSQANPLRKPDPAIKTEPIKKAAAEDPTTEPKWRAATHYSKGTNTGYATTATAQKWNSRPVPGKSSPPAASTPQPQSARQQWRASK